MSNKFMIFRVCGQFFAIKLIQVKEVILNTELEPLPKTNKIIKGIFNLRGNIIPVLDVKQVLGLKGDLVDTPNVIVINSDEESKNFSIEVDEVIEVARIPDEMQKNEVESSRSDKKFIKSFVVELSGYEDKIIYVLSDRFSQTGEESEAA